jgi:hypothetical protein
MHVTKLEYSLNELMCMHFITFLRYHVSQLSSSALGALQVIAYGHILLRLVVIS